MKFPSKVLDTLHENFLKEKLMQIKVSNTGKSITIAFPSGISFDRAKISFHQNRLTVEPSADGLKISSNHITMQSKRFPEWPEHGKVELTLQSYVEEGAEVFSAKLPATLPRPKPIRRKQELVGETFVMHIPVGNVTIRLADRNHELNVPEGELLAAVLDWAKKGYLL